MKKEGSEKAYTIIMKKINQYFFNDEVFVYFPYMYDMENAFFYIVILVLFYTHIIYKKMFDLIMSTK